MLDALPVTVDEAKVKPRTAVEIAERAVATVICAVKGEEDDAKLIDDLTARFDASALFSPDERAYLAKQPAPSEDRSRFGWRYECVHVFLWALGHLPELNPPGALADAGQLVKTMVGQGRAGLSANAKPRPMGAVLDETDLYLRLHWGATELRLKGDEADDVDEEIVMERHRALNWLVRSAEAWDDVTTDT